MKNKDRLIDPGELARIADRAIAAARAAVAAGTHTIDASDMIASDNPVTAYIGQQIDGYVVPGKIRAQVELDSAAREIIKLGRSGKMIAPEAMRQWDRIRAVAAELRLNEDDA